MSNLKKNLSLQTAYQVLVACTPLITAPYLARKLGAEQLGIFSYTTSIVLYFTMAAMLGTVNYGSRSIAAVKENRKKRDNVFTCIFSFQIIVTIVVILAYVAYLLFFCSENQLIASLQGISLMSCLVNVNWFFFGMEEFRITATRSIAIKIAIVALILLLVKDESDLWIYTVIMLGGTFVSDAIMLFYLPKYVSFTKVSFKQIKEHIKPNLVLFIPLLAMSVYQTMDKTMLGALSTYEQSGFYYSSDKIVQIPWLAINGIGTVMLPRMTSLISKGNQKEADNLFISTLEGVAIVSIAMAFGIAAVSNEFVPLFFGAGYEPCIALTIAFTPILLFKGISVITRSQYLIPMKMEAEFTKSVIGGAIVNFILNFLLIPSYGAMGATISTVVAEVVACIIQLLSLRGKNIGIVALLEKIAIYAIMGLIMFGVVRAVALLHIGTVIKLVIEIFVGALLYGILCFFYWSKTKNVFYEIVCQPILKRIRSLRM